MKKIKTLNEELKRMQTLLDYKSGTSYSDTLDEQTRIGTKRKYISFDWGKGKPITLRKKRQGNESLEMGQLKPNLNQELWDKFLKKDGRITSKMGVDSKNIWESLKNSDKSLSDCDEECQKQKGFAVASLERFNETYKKYKWQKVELGETKREDTTPPTPPNEYPGFNISLPFSGTPSSEYFENDEWEVTDLLKKEVSEKIISVLKDAMSDFNCDDEEDRAYLDNISISTSASRLRNGESHTWLELSKKRNTSALEYITNQLKSIGVAIDGNTKINQKFDGENGDGSSGPNPPKGYEVSKNGSHGSKIENATEEDRNIKGKPYGSIEEYEKHKYCNVKLDVIINHCVDPKEEGEDEGDSLEFEDYKITFSSYRSPLTIYLPKILTNWDKKYKQKNYKKRKYSCVFFDQGKLTRKDKNHERKIQKMKNN